MERDMRRIRMGIYQDTMIPLTINPVERRLLAPEFLVFDRTDLVREVDEDSVIESQEVHVVSGLNSVRFVNLAYRLELYNHLSVDDEVGSNVADVLAVVKNRDDAFRLIVKTLFSQGDFECTMIDGFGVTRTKRGPDVLGNRFH
jgi:hypothetical protein